MRTARLIICILLTLLLSVTAAAEPALTVEEGGLALGVHRLRWPQLSNLADEALQARLNTLLLEHAHAAELTARMAALFSAETPLESEYTLYTDGGLLRFLTRIHGPVRSDRLTTDYDSLCADLESGDVYTLSDVIPDTDGLEALLDELSMALSAQLLAGSLTPVPEVFTLTENGLTLYYPAAQYVQLNGEPGTVFLSWQELEPLLPAGEGALWRRAGGEGMLNLTGESRALLEAAAEKGTLPGVPARLGDALPELTGRYGLETDPDFYRDGRYIQLSDGAFRGVLLMTDRLFEKDLTRSVVRGIRLERGSVYGLRLGHTSRGEALAALGEPEAAAQLPEADAEAWRLPAGVSDYYSLGGHTLRLHYDTDDTLRCLLLLE